MNTIYKLTLILSSLLLSACTVGPDYVKPDKATSTDWGSQSEQLQFVSDDNALRAWWDQFDDPMLTSLINRAIDNNLDIEIARTRLLEARAGRKRARSFSLPQINSSASYQRLSLSQETDSAESGLNQAGLIERQSNLYEVGFDASFEIDIFGGNRRRVEAASARIDAAEEGIREVQTAIVAEVGRAYMEIRGVQFERHVLNTNLELQNETLRITEQNKQAGLANALDVSRARAQVEATAARIPELDARIEANSYAIALLTGELPDAWLEPLKEVQSIAGLPEIIPAGLPIELLRRRPDIRRTERELAASNADVGVAISDLYPKFFLSGLGALQSNSTGSLFSSSAFAFGIGPAISLPIFQGGRIRANIEGKKAVRSRAELIYEKSILTALSEVETNLSSYGRQKQALATLEKSVEAARTAAVLARKLYQDGLGQFLDVLDAERELRNLENELARQRTSTAVTLIALFKSLGGGWSESEDNLT